MRVIKKETELETLLDESSKRIEEERDRLKEVRTEMETAFKALAGDIAKSNSESFLNFK